MLAPSKRNRQEFIAGRVDLIAAYDDPILEQFGYKLTRAGTLPVRLWLRKNSSISSLQDTLNSRLIATPSYREFAEQAFSNLRLLPTNSQFPALLYSQRYDGAIASVYSFMYQAQQACIALAEFKSIPLANAPYYFWLRKDKGHDAFIERWRQVVKREALEQRDSQHGERLFTEFLSDFEPQECPATMVHN